MSLDLTNRTHLNLHTFISDCLPPLLLYILTAVLALLPNTLPLRLALLPFTLWSSIHAITTVDLSQGNPWFNYMNKGFGIGMLTIVMRCLDWTFLREPLKRAKNDNVERTFPQRLETLIFDTLDLLWNLRGIGWTWSKGLQLPPQTRPTRPVSTFLLVTLFSLLCKLVIFDALHYLVQSFSPDTFGSPVGGSIFLSSVPYPLLYALIITWFCGFAVCLAVEVFYDLATLIGILIFQQKPSQWPPIDDIPWCATSLSELWSKRWHQSFRSSFISLGARPLLYLTGGSRAAAVMGAFAVSALLHHWGLWAMARGSDFLSVGGFFLLHGLAVVLETVFLRLTGCRVGGRAGNVWIVAFMGGSGSLLIDAWARRGLIGSRFIPEEMRPGKHLVGLLLHLKDTWLLSRD